MNKTNFLKTSVLAAAVLVAATACKEDLTPLTTAWTGMEKQWAGSIDGLAGKVTELETKLAALPKDLPNRDKLDAAVKAAATSVASGKEALTKAKASFDEAVKSGKSVNVKGVMDKVKTEMTGLATRVEGDVGAAGKLLDEAKAAAEAAAAALAAKVEPFKKAAAEGGKLAVAEVAFKGDTADVDDANAESVAALDRIVDLSKTCDGIRYELIGHVAGDAKKGAKLSEDRAKAVKAALVAKGVDAAKIAKTAGKGPAEPGITVNVTTACK